MTTAKEQFKNDLQRDPEDLEREADSVREDLEGTVDRLMHQLSPSELLDRGISMLRNTGDYDFVRNLIVRVENNPIPTVLAGVSLIWLMTASKEPSAHREKLASATSSFKASSHDAAERTREAGQQVASGASDVMQRVRDTGRHTAESARTGLRDAREGYTQMLREQPLLVGVLAVAAGAALGALLPRTSTEDRVLGEWSDRGADTLKEKTEEQLHKVQGEASPESGGRDDASSHSTPSPKATNKGASGVSGGGGSPAGAGTGQSAGKPPPEPASPGAGRESGNTHRGTNY